jgi:hypothetical protein
MRDPLQLILVFLFSIAGAAGGYTVLSVIFGRDAGAAKQADMAVSAAVVVIVGWVMWCRSGG